MKIDLVATGGGRYRVFRDGVELSAHTAQHTAFEAGIAAKQAALGSLVEVVTDFRVRIEITDTVPAPAPEPEPEPTPNPEPPPILADGTLLRDVASTLQPGEWRQVSTQLAEGYTSFKAMQIVVADEYTPEGGSKGADGMGWTERLIEHKGTLMLPLMRDLFGKALLVMDASGQWHRINRPEGWSLTKSERRPFNRWFKHGGYAHFAPADAKDSMGYTLRTPLDNPGVFERYGVIIGDTTMDSVGNFSMCSAWGRLWAYTPGGRLRSWGEGETAWTHNYAHILKADRCSGYAGTIIYNPVRDEVVAIGGQYFGDNPDISDRAMRVVSVNAVSELFKMTFADGKPMVGVTASMCRFLCHPVTGEYLMLYFDGQMYRSVDGRVWRLYQDLRTLKPWGGYEQYCPWTLLEDTDVIVMVSHERGVWLHKLRG